MGSYFKMKDLGGLTHILGVKVTRDRKHRTLTLSQGAYIKQILERYNMSDCNPCKLPFSPGLNITKDDEPLVDRDANVITDFRGKIGSLIYDMKQTRKDIA